MHKYLWSFDYCRQIYVNSQDVKNVLLSSFHADYENIQFLKDCLFAPLLYGWQLISRGRICEETFCIRLPEFITLNNHPLIVWHQELSGFFPLLYFLRYESLTVCFLLAKLNFTLCTFVCRYPFCVVYHLRYLTHHIFTLYADTEFWGTASIRKLFHRSAASAPSAPTSIGYYISVWFYKL